MTYNQSSGLMFIRDGMFERDKTRRVSREESAETEVNREGRYHDDFLDMDFECFKTACDVRNTAMTTQSGIVEKFADSDGAVYIVDTKTKRGMVSISKDDELMYIQPRHASYTQEKRYPHIIRPFYWAYGLENDYDKGVVRKIDPRFEATPSIPGHPMICDSVEITGKGAVFDYWYRGDYHNQRFITKSKAIVRQAMTWGLDTLTASGVLTEIDIRKMIGRPYTYYQLDYIAGHFPTVSKEV